MTYRVTAEIEAAFDRDGYVFARGFLTPEETDLLQRTVRADDIRLSNAMDIRDAAGKRTDLALWNHPGDDLYGMIARSRRMVEAVETLLGGEVYHYHSKLSAKQPREGGAWEWHQDYGYWYANCLFPDMLSVFLAVDRCDRENGCLQVIRGSHKLGRIDHVRIGNQTGADPERVKLALTRMERVYCEMEPGDAIFFHGNTLHASDQNLSDRPRWGLIYAWNRASNDPFREHHHPQYTPLSIVDDAAILACGSRTDSASTTFHRKETEPEVKTTGKV